jgi:serine/threonine-protein kinase RsbW
MAGDPYRLSGLAVPETIDLLHELLAEVRVDHPDVTETDLSMLETAIVEIAGNVVQHGADAGARFFDFVLEVQPDRLVGTLGYEGGEVGERAATAGERELPDALAEGGRGLLIAESVLDELSYSFTEGRNSWQMLRLRSGTAARS